MYEIPLYEAEVEREGSDITIVATQIMLDKAHKAADIMAKEGVSVEIIDPRTIYPYDKEHRYQKSVAKTRPHHSGRQGRVQWRGRVAELPHDKRGCV